MHEMGLMLSVLDSVEKSAHEAGAASIDEIHLSIGEMTEVIPESLEFAFEALAPGTMCEGAKLICRYVGCHSRCNACGREYDHDRFNLACPFCGSFATELMAGRELYIDSVEVEIPDDGERPVESGTRNGSDGQDGA